VTEKPPSTQIAWPVTNPPAFQARKTALGYSNAIDRERLSQAATDR
jgi:hypothetical protein